VLNKTINVTMYYTFTIEVDNVGVNIHSYICMLYLITDYTLWPFWVDRKVNVEPPFSRTP